MRVSEEIRTQLLGMIHVNTQYDRRYGNTRAQRGYADSRMDFRSTGWHYQACSVFQTISWRLSDFDYLDHSMVAWIDVTTKY